MPRAPLVQAALPLLQASSRRRFDSPSGGGPRRLPALSGLCFLTTSLAVPLSGTRQGQQGVGLQGPWCIFAQILSQEGPVALLTSLHNSSVAWSELALSRFLPKKRHHPCCVFHQHVCGERAVLRVTCEQKTLNTLWFVEVKRDVIGTPKHVRQMMVEKGGEKRFGGGAGRRRGGGERRGQGKKSDLFNSEPWVEDNCGGRSPKQPLR